MTKFTQLTQVIASTIAIIYGIMLILGDYTDKSVLTTLTYLLVGLILTSLGYINIKYNALFKVSNQLEIDYKVLRAEHDGLQASYINEIKENAELMNECRENALRIEGLKGYNDRLAKDSLEKSERIAELIAENVDLEYIMKATERGGHYE